MRPRKSDLFHYALCLQRAWHTIHFTGYFLEKVRMQWGNSVLVKCPDFATFVSFHRVNTPIVADFKVPRWRNGTWSWEVMHTIGSPSSASRLHQWKYKTGPRLRRRNKIQFCFVIKHFVPRVSKREGNRCYLLKWDFNSSGKIIMDNQKLTA